MDPKLTALLANSAGMSKLKPNDKAYVELIVNSLLFNQPTDAGSLANNHPKGLSFFSPDEILNAELYAIAVKLGLPTDGTALYNACFNASGYMPANVLPVRINGSWLHYLGAF